MSTTLYAAFTVLVCLIIRVLNINGQSKEPAVWCVDERFLTSLYSMSMSLNERYTPPLLWGFNGHIQTILNRVLARFRSGPWPEGERIYLSLTDGSTLTYDIFEPLPNVAHANGADGAGGAGGGPDGGDGPHCATKAGPPSTTKPTTTSTSTASPSASASASASVSSASPSPSPSPSSSSSTLASPSTNELTEKLGRLMADHDVTIVICPGICNSSESIYVRTFVAHAQCHGVRCAVLNHIGTLQDVAVTSSRIFTYGDTTDFAEMMNHLNERYPQSTFVAVGFSLGGNLVTKYMGQEHHLKPANLIGAISICQGYNAQEGCECLTHWKNFRRFYLYMMTHNLKRIIMHHRHVLLSDEVKIRHNLNEKQIMMAKTIQELDEAYTRRVLNFHSLQELYHWSSSVHYVDKIDKPMIFINARDDPLIPEGLLKPIKEYAQTRSKTAYVEVAHGGHLGFYEGGLLYPNPVTWLNRTLVSMVASIVSIKDDDATATAITNIDAAATPPSTADAAVTAAAAATGAVTAAVVNNGSNDADNKIV